MYFQTSLLALGLLPAVILAAPNTPSPTKRAAACSTIYPEFARVVQAQPVESYLPGFIISQDAGASNKNDMYIEFTVPAGTGACQLETFFPANAAISASGRQDVYIFSTAGPVTRSPRGIDISWAYSPAVVSQIGTTRFESNPTAETRKVINSFACQSTMTYRLSIGRDFTDAGSVSFNQYAGNGLRMTYNC